MTDLEERVRQCLAGTEPHPLALVGPTGSGKTSLLRAEARAGSATVRWSSARGLAEGLVGAIREDRLGWFSKELATDHRPLVVEHVEDLRGRSRTRHELQVLLQARATRGNPTVLTLTLSHDVEATLGWLRGWADVFETEVMSLPG